MARRNQSAVHGDTVAVGVILDDAPNGDQGSAYVFVGLHR
jgi:FG-GAP repeat